MKTEAEKQIRIDLDQFKFHINIGRKLKLSLHFDSPSRKFYLSVITFVVNEMMINKGETHIPLEKHHEILALFNETVGNKAGSSSRKNLIPRIYKKWKSALPDLENAPLFRIIGRKKEYSTGFDRVYVFSEDVKDSWANLFNYRGSGEKVRLRFSIDTLGVSLDDIAITFKNYTNEEAYKHFVTDQKGVSKSDKLSESTDVLAFPRSDKPSIAVLPFTNISGDPSQEYFSDGLTEQIINGLCKVSNLFVIAKNSSFAYKGKAVSIKQIAKELGVRYILEGSVQKAGNRVRITAQVIDATTDFHMWSENYDRDLEDIFALQDEITMKLIAAMGVTLTRGEQNEIYIQDISNIQALESFFKSMRYLMRFNKDDNAQARNFLEQALKFDESSATIYASIGFTHTFDFLYSWSDSPPDSLNEAEKNAQKAIILNKNLDYLHRLLAYIHMYRKRFNEALQAAKKAVALSPNGADAHAVLGMMMNINGKVEMGLIHINKAIRLNPHTPNWYYFILGDAYRSIGKVEKAISVLKHSIAIEPEALAPYPQLILCYVIQNQFDRAKNAAKKLLGIDPQFSLRDYKERVPIKEQSTLDLYINALRKAGLPD